MAGLFILLKQKLCVAPRPLQLNSMVTISDCPSELLFLLPFLQRANEMNDSQPVLAYYCKYYAISFALGGGPSGKFQRSPQTDAFVSRLFDDLEAAKLVLKNHSAMKETTTGAVYVREMAYRVFLSAEKQESSPSTLKKALQSYLAAVNFLQVYRGVFFEEPSVLNLDEEERTSELAQIDEKSKYAKWRIMEIKKTLKSTDSIGVISKSSPQASTTNMPLHHMAASPSAPVPHVVSHVAVSPVVSPINTFPAVVSPVYPASTSPVTPALLYDPKVLSNCEKSARHAISALQFDDVESAAANLRTALELLRPYLKENKH